jgi:uncharacterized membrane protein
MLHEMTSPGPSSVEQPPLRWPLVYLSVALTTLATLLLELSLTRIFSVVFFYHFAFLAISIALFGLGAGGVFSYVVAGWRHHLFIRLGWLSALNSLLVIVVLVLVLAGRLNNWGLVLIYGVAALPFFVAGTILSLAISETIQHVDRVYFFDLMGAAGGCLVLVPLLNHLGGPGTVIAVAVLFAAAGAVWQNMAGSRWGRAGCLALTLGLVGFLAYNTAYHLVDVKYAKSHRLENESFVKWNSFSRVALRPMKPSGGDIIIDADADTWIASFDFENLTALDRQRLLMAGPGLPYVLRPGAKTLVIGPGGGYDVARCLASGSKDVTGVEINPIIATTIMREKFPELSQRIYFRPEVHIVVEDGRSFVRRSPEKYQVLQATLVDTWASTAAGAFALAENNLYTVEAFRDYLGHLTDDGLVAFTRWTFDPPRESLRLVSLGMEALAQMGERDPWRHVIVGRQGETDTVLISREPFPDADLSRARAALAGPMMQAVYVPGDVGHGRGSEFAELLRSPNPLDFERRYAFDITPVTDNRPFFFYTVQPRDMWWFLTAAARAPIDYKVNQAVPTLFGLMGISVVATLVILLLPPMVLGTRLPRQKGLLTFLLYFLFIGAGYILIEVALIQRFVLFLGHPTYALTVVIFSMLVSSGLGSYFSRRTLKGIQARWVKALGAIAILVALLGILAWSVVPMAVGLPLWLKIALTVLMISPVGFLMGMPFPTGLTRLEEWHKPSVRWAWSLNAASSVLGSVGALLCAIYLGLLQTLLMGSVLYLAALAIVLRVGSRARGEQTAAEPQAVAAA